MRDENNYYLYEDSSVQHVNQPGHGLVESFDKLSYNLKEDEDFAYDAIQYIRNIPYSLNAYEDDDTERSKFSIAG
ncbi:hypothetical protein C922_03735 [Plasmodium inui San Antonio 1]|uniref:Uncharacterized protein n=1 Tax=Plasmodium inui San Antonio 1 TaxID=1237626 RepID=W6ZY52_9APIC|nr:hypothetical protein C922_03735 [Plasmodium inui San Antonio 1]EUD65752.1 hypothetical protein C922_03735 [Plasmodium inui San Antonio 1]